MKDSAEKIVKALARMRCSFCSFENSDDDILNNHVMTYHLEEAIAAKNKVPTFSNPFLEFPK